MKPLTVFVVSAILALVSITASGEPLPLQSGPGRFVVAKARADRAASETDVDKGKIPGAVALVGRKGRVAYFEAFGSRDNATGAPMTKDAIFRIYSMTKPVTSVAALMLVEEEEGCVLTDPVSRYLPALAKLEVAVPRLDPGTGRTTYDLVPAERSMTIQDLLRHTSGLTYGDTTPNTRVKEAYAKTGVDWKDMTPAEQVERLGKVPLAFQPGTVWHYGLSTDVLGRVVEVVSGARLGQFFQERIFAPLKMTDSGFLVPKGEGEAHRGTVRQRPNNRQCDQATRRHSTATERRRGWRRRCHHDGLRSFLSDAVEWRSTRRGPPAKPDHGAAYDVRPSRPDRRRRALTGNGIARHPRLRLRSWLRCPAQDGIAAVHGSAGDYTLALRRHVLLDRS